jgi:serine/threonine protein kinase
MAAETNVDRQLCQCFGTPGASETGMVEQEIEGGEWSCNPENPNWKSKSEAAQGSRCFLFPLKLTCDAKGYGWAGTEDQFLKCGKDGIGDDDELSFSFRKPAGMPLCATLWPNGPFNNDDLVVLQTSPRTVSSGGQAQVTNFLHVAFGELSQQVAPRVATLLTDDLPADYSQLPADEREPFLSERAAPYQFESGTAVNYSTGFWQGVRKPFFKTKYYDDYFADANHSDHVAMKVRVEVALAPKAPEAAAGEETLTMPMLFVDHLFEVYRPLVSYGYQATAVIGKLFTQHIADIAGLNVVYGGTGNYTFSLKVSGVAAIETWLRLSATGEIHGTPQNLGPELLAIEVEDVATNSYNGLPPIQVFVIGPLSVEFDPDKLQDSCVGGSECVHTGATVQGHGRLTDVQKVTIYPVESSGLATPLLEPVRSSQFKYTASAEDLQHRQVENIEIVVTSVVFGGGPQPTDVELDIVCKDFSGSLGSGIELNADSSILKHAGWWTIDVYAINTAMEVAVKVEINDEVTAERDPERKSGNVGDGQPSGDGSGGGGSGGGDGSVHCKKWRSGFYSDDSTHVGMLKFEVVDMESGSDASSADGVPVAVGLGAGFGVLALCVVAALTFLKFVWQPEDKLLSTPPFTFPDKADPWEFPRERLALGSKLGQGAFGVVYSGTALNIRNQPGMTMVAVKQCAPKGDDADKHDFVTEAGLMKRFKHPNIVRLLGISMQEEPLSIIVELMALGDMKEYLRANHSTAMDILLKLSVDVASGLAYLARMDVVHRDLAARNMLLDDSMTAKIADFGMMRNLVLNDYYRVDKHNLLPVRWMPIEALQLGKFTSASDVWSLGVVFWEVTCHCEMPYPAMGNSEVYDFVKAGRRLSQPPGCPDFLFRIMERCWHKNPASRPTAIRVLTDLSAALRSAVSDTTSPLHGSTVLTRRLVDADMISSVSVDLSSERGWPARSPNSKVDMILQPHVGADGYAAVRFTGGGGGSATRHYLPPPPPTSPSVAPGTAHPPLLLRDEHAEASEPPARDGYASVFFGGTTHNVAESSSTERLPGREALGSPIGSVPVPLLSSVSSPSPVVVENLYFALPTASNEALGYGSEEGNAAVSTDIDTDRATSTDFTFVPATRSGIENGRPLFARLPAEDVGGGTSNNATAYARVTSVPPAGAEVVTLQNQSEGQLYVPFSPEFGAPPPGSALLYAVLPSESSSGQVRAVVMEHPTPRPDATRPAIPVVESILPLRRMSLM